MAVFMLYFITGLAVLGKREVKISMRQAFLLSICADRLLFDGCEG